MELRGSPVTLRCSTCGQPHAFTLRDVHPDKLPEPWPGFKNQPYLVPFGFPIDG